MAFSPLMCDSFDHYNSGNILDKWGATSPQAVITMTNPRTGTRACACTTLGGPTTKTGVTGNRGNLIVGHALLVSSVVAGVIMIFADQSAGDFQCYAQVNGDGSISVINHINTQPGPTLLTTPPGLVQAGVYAYIEYGIIFSAAGSVYVRVNGVLVGSATGVNTIHSPNSYCDAVSLSGPPSILAAVFTHDDFYMGFSTTPLTISNDFLGALRFYPYVAVANKTPLQWTPSANTNYQQVANIPPDPANYVSDSTIGHVDQYEMQPISGQGPSGAFTIVFGQTVMSAALSGAGSGQAAPNIGGNAGTSVGLSTSFSMYLQTYLNNPVTGVPFVPADFLGATTMGPEVTG